MTLDRDGQVFENKQVTGSIIVTAPNVTIRNVRLVVTDPYYGISVRTAETGTTIRRTCSWTMSRST